MRTKLSMFFVAVLALGLSAVSAEAQQRGGVLKFATPSVKPGLDPARTRTGDGYMLTAMIFSNLTRISHELKPEPQLAHKWETNEDSSEWTFHLRKDAKFTEVLSKTRNINWLSAARLFLFGARDVWFVVGIPIYFYAVLSDGSVESKREAFFMIGSFMAVWTILYGAVQGWAPKILRATGRTEGETLAQARHWNLALVVVPAVLAALVWITPAPSPALTGTIVIGLLVFGAIFAVNSALHSYLILSFTDAKRVTMDVGFYYMSNAAGRLVGTLLSGFTYQLGGLALCLGTAALMLALSALGTAQLRPSQTS